MKEEIIYDVKVEGVQSIENLTKANKELREERKKLDLQSQEGHKRAQEINKQLDENTEIIKKNSSALEKQRLNVGNYSGALDKLVPGLGATANGFAATSKAAYALVANPIGAVLTALTVTIGTVIKYLTGSAEGQDKLNKVMAVGGAIIGKVSDALTYLGKYAIEGVVKGFGILIKGLDYLIPGFSALVDIVGDKLNKALGDPAALAALKNRNDLLERELVILKATNEARIAELKLKAEDKSLDLKTRQEALREALKLQTELTAKQQEFAQNKLDISKQEHAQSESTKEDLLEEKQLEAELILLKKDAADKSKEIFTKEQALRDEQRAKEKAARDEKIKQDAEDSEIQRAKRIRELEEEQSHGEKVLEIKKANADKSFAIAQKELEGKIKISRSVVEVQMAEHQQLEQLKMQAFSTATTLFSKYKEGQIGLSLISTYFSAQKAFESQFLPYATVGSPVRGAIAAALAVVQGLARTNEIRKVPAFAMGGLTGTKITRSMGTPISRLNGDDLLATVKTGEVILNKRQQMLLGGDRVFRNIGVPGFASGGSTSINRLDSNIEFSKNQAKLIAESVRSAPVIVTVEDINAGQSRVKVIEDRASIL